MNEPTWQFEHSIACNTNKSFAWTYWTDISNWQRLEGKAVEWIKLDGPFEVGSSGITKMPGQAPHHWQITQLDPEQSATITMPLDGAMFYNEFMMESISPNRTRFIQRLSLAGTKAPDYTEGIRMFETSAPQGLAKLVEAIESAFRETNQLLE